jgi:very-short-patch-repair endonuclease
VSALVAAGLTGFELDRVDVSLPHANRHHCLDGVRVVRRRKMPRTVAAGIPRVHPASAVLHAAEWAVSDRQAALLLCLVVQQRLVRPADLVVAWGQVGRSRRRVLIGAIVADLCDGVHSLGELDFAAHCRARGLPVPSRQVVRTTPQGRIYLDVGWEDIRLVVEIDGGHHAAALNPVDDALRQNELVLTGERVLRIPVIGLRVSPDLFMAQVEQAHAELGRAVA